MSAKLLGNIILKGKIECLTGMHIGGSKDKFEIGGVDSPVIRDPNTSYPYIPGSSLKGKMRSLLAFALDKADVDTKDSYKPNCPLQRIFGVPGDKAEKGKEIGPARLIVRDAYPDKKTMDMWESLDSELVYTEYKPENSINRLTSAANPRFLERVVKGSFFNVEFVFGVYDIDDHKDTAFVKDFFNAMKLLEHSYIGGSGSRGYGQIAFKLYEPMIVKIDDYEKGSPVFKESLKSIDDLIIDKENWHKRLSDFDEEFIQKNIISKFN